MKHPTNSSISLEQIQTLTSSIYDAALEPDQWDSVLGELAKTIKAEQANIRILNSELNDVKLAYTHNKNPEWNKIYKEHFIHIDPWLNNIFKPKTNAIVCTHHYLTNKEYEKLEFYNEFVSPQKTHYGMGVENPIDKDASVYITLNRNKNKQGFEDEYRKALLQLVPHIQKSLLINNKVCQLELKENLLSNALNHINSPTLLINKFGKILFINPLAEQLITQHDGICIKNNHILILSERENKYLKQLIHQATDKNSFHQQGGAMNFKPPGKQTTLSILISPVNPDKVNMDIQSSECAILILSSQQQQPSISDKLLSDLYKLTPAEARLSVELCKGFTINEISERFSLSKNTLRTQLRHCFNKTGVSRQIELIRLIKEGPAGIIKNI